METTRPHLTQNVRHLGLKLAALAGAIATYNFAAGTTATYAAIAATIIAAGFAAELVWSARGEDISPGVRLRYLIVSIAGVALLAVYRHSAVPYRHEVEGLLALVCALCAWEVVSRMRNRFVGHHRPRLRGFSVVAEGERADTRAEVVQFVERRGGRMELVAERGEDGRASLKYLILAPAAEERAIRAFIQQSFESKRDLIVREESELTAVERYLIRKWHEVGDEEAVEQRSGAMPELTDAVAYKLRFKTQPGAALLTLAESEHVFDAIATHLNAAVQEDEVLAAGVALDLVPLRSIQKVQLTHQMREQLDDGSSSDSLRFVGFGGAFGTRAVHAVLFFVLPVLAWKLTGIGWILVVPFVVGLVFARRFVASSLATLWHWMWHGKLEHRSFSLFERDAAAPLTEQERAVRDQMKKKASGRLLTGALTIYVLPAELAEDASESEIASRAQTLERVAKELAAAVEVATEGHESGAELEAVRLDDPRLALSGEPPAQVDTRFLLKPSEIAAIMRPPGASASRVFDLDRLSVANLGVDPRLAKSKPAEGKLTIGTDAPGTAAATEVAIDVDDLEANAIVCGASGSGKSTWLSSALRDVIVAGRSVFSLDAGASMNDRAIRRLARTHPHILRDDRFTVVEWGDADYPVYFNPAIARTEQEVPTALKRMIRILESADVELSAQMAAANIYAIGGTICRATWLQREVAKKVGRPFEEIFAPGMVDIYLLLDDFELLQAFAERFATPIDRKTLEKFIATDEKDRAFVMNPIDWRVRALLRNTELMLILASERNEIDFLDAIKKQEVVLHNTQVLGADDKTINTILATLYASYCDDSETWYDQMRKQHREDDIVRHFMFTDESKQLMEVADKLEKTFSQLRKTGMTVVLGMQYPEQFKGDALQEARQNVANWIAFKLSDPSDILAKVFGVAKDYFINIDDHFFLGRFKMKDRNGKRVLTDTNGFTSSHWNNEPPAEEWGGEPKREQLEAVIIEAQERSRKKVARPRAEALKVCDMDYRREQLWREIELYDRAMSNSSPSTPTLAAVDEPVDDEPVDDADPELEVRPSDNADAEDDPGRTVDPSAWDDLEDIA